MPPQVIVLDNLTVQDLARALKYSGYAVSNTAQSNLFVIKAAARELPSNVVDFPPLAFLRRQAD